MDSSSFEIVEKIFHELAELSADEQSRKIAEYQKSSPDSLRRALDLLGISGSLGDFLEKPPAFADPLELPEGAPIDDFRIDRKLGEGSFGNVYLARQLSLGRTVALKISPDLGEEGRTMAPLEHEAIVRIFFEKRLEQSGIRLLCMQYVPGLALDEVLREARRRGKLDGKTFREIVSDAAIAFDEQWESLDAVELCLSLGKRMLSALDHAHSLRVLHLDVKPGNILIHRNGQAYLSDFNVSTKDGAVDFKGGTERYMAPEQARWLSSGGATPGQAADLFALGKVMAEMLAFTKEWGEEAPDVTCTSIEANEIVARLTQENPADRYASAAIAVRAIDSCLERRKVAKALPPLGALRRQEFLRPLFFLIALPLFPQVLGSIINISYNELRIISTLTLAQQKTFSILVIFYNVIVYSLCVIYLTFSLSPLTRQLYRGIPPLGTDLSPLRPQIFEVPRRLIKLITFGWMPGALFFPLMLDLISGPVDRRVYLHFFASFALSWLVAMTYSFLHQQMFLLRIIYPRLLRGASPLRQTAAIELGGIEGWLRWFYHLAGVVPLFAALIILWEGTLPTTASAEWIFKGLMSLLIGMAALGFVSSLRGREELSATIFALTGEKAEKRPQ